MSNKLIFENWIPTPRERFLKYGYYIARKVFDPGYIQELRDHFVTRIGEQKEAMATIAIDICQPRYQSFVTHPVAQTLLRSLGCPDLKLYSGYFIPKPAGEGRRPWHYDWSCWNEPQSYEELGPEIALMYYFQKTDDTNGCLEVWPGSHRNLTRGHAFEKHEEWFLPQPDGIQLHVEPGDVVVADARTLHATMANNSDQPRLMATIWYWSNWSGMSEDFRARFQERNPAGSRLGSLYAASDRPYFADYPLRAFPDRERMGRR